MRWWDSISALTHSLSASLNIVNRGFDHISIQDPTSLRLHKIIDWMWLALHTSHQQRWNVNHLRCWFVCPLSSTTWESTPRILFVNLFFLCLHTAASSQPQLKATLENVPIHIIDLPDNPLISTYVQYFGSFIGFVLMSMNLRKVCFVCCGSVYHVQWLTHLEDDQVRPSNSC